AEVDTSEETLAALAQRVDRLAGELATAATGLTKARTKAAKALGKAVTAELAGLAMDRAAFTIAVEPIPARADDSAPLTLPSGQAVHAGSSGTDAVEFGFAAHRDNPMLPLAKSASGGELSRVMLALEVVLAASTAGTTMVFDEVDAGVGGRAAVQIGRRLARLAHTHQVIDRVAELARMLAGLGDSDTGRAHARELLDAARAERA
ncbi:DNA recombination/repair protein RecN like protein, partial [Aduncisulcus paluster]